MIIPVRCVSCGKVLADKWMAYDRRVRELKDEGVIDDEDVNQDVVRTRGKKAPRGKILDDLDITRICCRRMMLTHVDLVDVI